MVSSKCLRTSSPSPFKSLAALMPPWAQTECERLTGTMEKRSTVPPASAILMTAERPARPPPTTMMRGVAAMCYLLCESKTSERTCQKSALLHRYLLNSRRSLNFGTADRYRISRDTSGLLLSSDDQP